MKKKPSKYPLPTQITFPLIDSLRPDPNNARERTPENMAAVKASLQRFGQVTPVVTKADGTIMKGNGTWLVAKELGWKNIARIFIGDRNEDQASEYALIDNQSSDLSRFNPERLKAQLKKIRDRNESITSLGFHERDLKALLGKIQKHEPAATVAAPSKMVHICPDCGKRFSTK